MSRSTTAASVLTVDRRRNDRRNAAERLRPSTTHASSSTANTGSEHRTSDRRKVERRRQIDPTTCERDYTDEQVEFMKAMDLYKRRSGRQFPTWSEVLEVLQNLGYRKVAPQTEMYQHAQPS